MDFYIHQYNHESSNMGLNSTRLKRLLIIGRYNRAGADRSNQSINHCSYAMLAETEACIVSTSLRDFSTLVSPGFNHVSANIHIYMCAYTLCEPLRHIHIFILYFLKEFSHLNL